MNIPDLPASALPDRRGLFNKKAEPLTLVLKGEPFGGPQVELKPKRFPSGAVGWTSGSKVIYLQVGGVWERCKVSVVVRVVNSNRWPEARGG